MPPLWERRRRRTSGRRRACRRAEGAQPQREDLGRSATCDDRRRRLDSSRADRTGGAAAEPMACSRPAPPGGHPGERWTSSRIPDAHTRSAASAAASAAWSWVTCRCRGRRPAQHLAGVAHQVVRARSASSPVSGSSSNSTSARGVVTGEEASALPAASPPDNDADLDVRRSRRARPARAVRRRERRSACAFGSSLHPQPEAARSRRPTAWGNSCSSWNTSLTLRGGVPGRRVTSSPSISTRPLGPVCSSPAITRSPACFLPEPDGPSRATISAAGDLERDTDQHEPRPPNRTVTAVSTASRASGVHHSTLGIGSSHPTRRPPAQPRNVTTARIVASAHAWACRMSPVRPSRRSMSRSAASRCRGA